MKITRLEASVANQLEGAGLGEANQLEGARSRLTVSDGEAMNPLALGSGRHDGGALRRDWVDRRPSRTPRASATDALPRRWENGAEWRDWERRGEGADLGGPQNGGYEGAPAEGGEEEGDVEEAHVLRGHRWGRGPVRRAEIWKRRVGLNGE